MITDDQTNTIYFSSLLPEKCPALNRYIADILEENRIHYAYLSETKDIWCRDFMPIQIEENRFVFYKYTPNYLEDALYLQTNPEKVFRAGENQLQHLLRNAVTIDLVLDGGNVATLLS